MNPKARQDDIVVQEVFDELVIYDLERDKVHVLNPTAAFVWQHCDGKHSPDQISALIQQKFETPRADELMWLSLDRLGRNHLLVNNLSHPTDYKFLTRRQMLKAGVSIALLPVVATLVAPTVAAQTSGALCTKNSDCGSLECCCIGSPNQCVPIGLCAMCSEA